MSTFLQESQSARSKRVFELQLESFMNTWAPSDSYNRSEFEAQLIGLVRQIYTDAQAPILEQLGKVASFTTLSALVERSEK